MKIAYRKHIWWSDQQWWDTFTDWLSRSPSSILKGEQGYSHVELVMSNGDWLSSTTEEGIRFTNRNYEVEAHPDWWEFEEIDVSEEDEAVIRLWAEKEIKWRQENKGGYDYKGILRFIFPFIKQSPKNYFCSECVCQALIEGGFYFPLPPHKISPNKLHQLPKVRVSYRLP